jgi:hypothetical protein
MPTGRGGGGYRHIDLKAYLGYLANTRRSGYATTSTMAAVRSKPTLALSQCMDRRSQELGSRRVILAQHSLWMLTAGV